MSEFTDRIIIKRNIGNMVSIEPTGNNFREYKGISQIGILTKVSRAYITVTLLNGKVKRFKINGDYDNNNNGFNIKLDYLYQYRTKIEIFQDILLSLGIDANLPNLGYKDLSYEKLTSICEILQVYTYE